MASIEESLRALRDVDGVYGSFVVAASGAVVSKDLPSAFEDELLSDVGPRILRLCESFASDDELESLMVRYAEHKLYVRKIGWGLIGIILGVRVNLPALRMVGNLVARRIDPEIASSGLRSTPSSLPPLPAPRRSSPVADPEPKRSESPPVVAQDGRESTPPTSDGHVRMYRGRRVVDE